jgi:hypothetical protein
MDQVRDPARAYLELEGVRVWAPDRSELLRDVTWRDRHARWSADRTR